MLLRFQIAIRDVNTVSLSILINFTSFKNAIPVYSLREI